MNAAHPSAAGILPAVQWFTPEDLDAIRLRADYERMDRGEIVWSPVNPLSRGPVGSGGKRTVPMLPDDEETLTRTCR